MKWELRQLERGWWHAHDETARAPYSWLMKTYEMAMQATKMDSIAELGKVQRGFLVRKAQRVWERDD